MSTAAFFSSRSDRDVLDFVVREFPFPLAVTYARLHVAMDGQEPIAAAWQLRDAFECLLKFTAGVAVADCLQDPQESDATRQQLVQLLFKPQGLSLGDWHSLLELALKPLQNREAGQEAGRRCLPELYDCFFQPNGRRTPLNRKIDGDAGSFVNWRNRVFGHGVFQQQRTWYAEQTLQWLPVLHEFYTALRPVLADWRLVGRTPGSETVDWQGSEEPASAPPHEHQPWGDPLSMQLVFRNGERTEVSEKGTDSDQDDRCLSPSRAAPRELPLGPLLSVQQCLVCQQPAAFFFDKHKYQRDKDKHRTFFREYFHGHHGEHRDWSETRQLATLLPDDFVWERTSYDLQAVAEGQRIVFRDFDDQYQRPDYLLEAIWQTVDTQDKGYVHLVGPEGTGKTYLMRGLQREGPDRGTPVLAYYIRTGDTTDYRTFVSELADRAREELRFRTQEIQTKVAAVDDLQEQFIEFVTELMRANRLDQLVVAIDALDELPEPDRESAGLTDLLPPAERLPDGCFVVLTSRRKLHPRVGERLAEIHRQDESRFQRMMMDPSSLQNRDLLRSYLTARLPEPFRTPAQVDALLARSGGVFLYAYHFCWALAAGAFADTDDLPPGEQFYPAYLARLRDQVGPDLYETVYLKTLLLLAAAQQPVTISQLEQWGVSGARLPVALLELRDLLHEYRVRRWHESLSTDGEHRYQLAHEAFIRYVSDDHELAAGLHAAHRTIAAHILARHSGRWNEIEAEEDDQLYALCHLPAHLTQSDSHDAAELLWRNDAYARGCWRVGDVLRKKARHQLALALYDRALAGCRRLVEQEGRAELANELAMSLMNLGLTMQNTGDVNQVVGHFSEAIGWWERLVQAEMHQVVSTLVKAYGIRLGVLVQAERWQEATRDVMRAFRVALPLLQGGQSPEMLIREFDGFVQRFRALTPEKRDSLYTALGPSAAAVQQVLEQAGG